MSDAEDALVNSGRPQPAVWRSVESLRSAEHWQPWTGLEETDECDDPERSVSFTDLSPFIFHTERTGRVQFRLIVGCLQSLGVPLLPGSQAQLLWAPLQIEEDLVFSLAGLPELIRLSSTGMPDLINSQSYYAFIRRVVIQSWTLLPDPYRLELALWWMDVERARAGRICNASLRFVYKVTDVLFHSSSYQ